MDKVCENPECRKLFQTIRNGHNARYCSKSCKEKVRYRQYVNRTTREQRYVHRRDVYRRIKDDPERAEALRGYNSGHKRLIREWLAYYKVSVKCCDCGFDIHPAALQWDHEGPKTASISELRSSIQRIVDEIRNGQCKCRCANCHSIKTWADKNGIKYRPGMIWSPSLPEGILKDLTEEFVGNDVRLDTAKGVQAQVHGYK